MELAAMRDYWGRSEYDFFSCFSELYTSPSSEGFYVVPDKFAKWSETTNRSKTVKRLKAELKELTKKKLV